ncbi:hypothetical protein DAEQUDRAFT_321128 [Daedalea quercina L-15889]|uniref:DUF6534 domain-containing protein n=1 Tax=Daedalea quercina L-15889 TaxID=1314783 RepID=A0A165PS17_9APHY|nr:hypothetical protein DAEQUDRAFT_321128 [Daedalea quercina L-15889]
MAGDAAIVNTVGVTLVEISIAVFLYGIATMQALVYWAKYRDDARWIRFGVVWEWFLETVHTVLCLHLIYSYTVFDWGDMEKTESIVWSFTASCFLAVFVAVFVQGFLGWRVYLLSKQDWRVILPLVLLLLMRATFGCCSISVMGMSKTWDHWRSLPYGRALLACALSSAAATDLYTWILLLYCLRRAQKTTRRTATLMKRLQIYVVSSGCLTMFISVTIILTFALMQSNLLFAGLIQIQSKLYANCFFAR